MAFGAGFRSTAERNSEKKESHGCKPVELQFERSEMIDELKDELKAAEGKVKELRGYL
jgi:TolA-binding protein